MQNKRIPADMFAGNVFSSNNFGDFEIVRYNTSNHVVIKFISTGFISVVTSNTVRTGAIKDPLSPHVFGVGFNGIGPHLPWENGKDTKVYSVWHSMLTRCYSKAYQKKQPTYIGCIVCEEWHNFQTFGDWFVDNYIDGYHLDKDIVFEGNKVYSPETCVFVSRNENNEKARAKHYVFISPQNEIIHIYNMRKFCSDNDLCFKCMSLVNVGKHKSHKSHKGWTKYATC